MIVWIGERLFEGCSRVGALLNELTTLSVALGVEGFHAAALACA